MSAIKKSKLKDIINSVDTYNEFGFDTFIEGISDCYYNIEAPIIDDTITFLEDELGIYSDMDLHSIEEDALDLLLKYMNKLFE